MASLFVEHQHGDGGEEGKVFSDLELEQAVAAAQQLTEAADTLLLVTADHSHALTINGYPRRHVDITGYDGFPGSQQRADDLQQSYFPTLMYSTGPGRRNVYYDVSRDKSLLTKDYLAPATIFRESASHQGEDVALYAIGPQSHLFRGLLDQHHIPHILAYGACIGEGITFCRDQQ